MLIKEKNIRRLIREILLGENVYVSVDPQKPESNYIASVSTGSKPGGVYAITGSGDVKSYKGGEFFISVDNPVFDKNSEEQVKVAYKTVFFDIDKELRPFLGPVKEKIIVDSEYNVSKEPFPRPGGFNKIGFDVAAILKSPKISDKSTEELNVKANWQSIENTEYTKASKTIKDIHGAISSQLSKIVTKLSKLDRAGFNKIKDTIKGSDAKNILGRYQTYFAENPDQLEVLYNYIQKIIGFNPDVKGDIDISVLEKVVGKSFGEWKPDFIIVPESSSELNEKLLKACRELYSEAKIINAQKFVATLDYTKSLEQKVRDKNTDEDEVQEKLYSILSLKTPEKKPFEFRLSRKQKIHELPGIFNLVRSWRSKMKNLFHLSLRSDDEAKRKIDEAIDEFYENLINSKNTDIKSSRALRAAAKTYKELTNIYNDAGLTIPEKIEDTKEWIESLGDNFKDYLKEKGLEGYIVDQKTFFILNKIVADEINEESLKFDYRERLHTRAKTRELLEKIVKNKQFKNVVNQIGKKIKDLFMIIDLEDKPLTFKFIFDHIKTDKSDNETPISQNELFKNIDKKQPDFWELLIKDMLRTYSGQYEKKLESRHLKIKNILIIDDNVDSGGTTAIIFRQILGLLAAESFVDLRLRSHHRSRADGAKVSSAIKVLTPVLMN